MPTVQRRQQQRRQRRIGRYREPMATDVEIMLPLHTLDVETYNQIVASGALEGQRVELLLGRLTKMSPRSPAHDLIVERLTRHFSPSQSRVRVQMAIEVAPDSEPEPDLAVVAGQVDASRHPRTALLAVEVSVTSQLVDRNVKASMYARAGIPVYWLVDVPLRIVEVRTEPQDDGYRRCITYCEGERVRCPVEGVSELDVTALLEGV